jgi:hypothetical protein
VAPKALVQPAQIKVCYRNGLRLWAEKGPQCGPIINPDLQVVDA